MKTLMTLDPTYHENYLTQRVPTIRRKLMQRRMFLVSVGTIAAACATAYLLLLLHEMIRISGKYDLDLVLTEYPDEGGTITYLYYSDTAPSVPDELTRFGEKYFLKNKMKLNGEWKIINVLWAWKD